MKLSTITVSLVIASAALLFSGSAVLIQVGLLLSMITGLVFSVWMLKSCIK